MTLNSDVSLPGNAGAHVALDDKPCPERTFRVVMIGVGGVYHDIVQCRRCHRDFKAYGNRILDPLTERLLDIPDGDNAIAGIKLSFRFTHGTANGQSEAAPKWFNDYGNAVAAFNGITGEAAVSAWPKHDATDTLTSVKVELWRKGIAEWECIDYKEYTP